MAGINSVGLLIGLQSTTSTLEEALAALLIANTTVYGIVGSRIYPVRAPQSPTLPYVVYNRISGPRDYTHDGAAGLARARVQFDAMAETYAGSKQLTHAIRGALSAASGTYAGVVIEASFLVSELDDFEETVEDYRVITDYSIFYQE